MGYSGGDRQNDLSYIVTDLLLVINNMSPRDSLDRPVALFRQQVSCFAGKDHASDDKALGLFDKEWKEIQLERQNLSQKDGNEDYFPGAEGFEQEDEAFRQREYGACIRCCYRNGIITKLPVNRTKWVPDGKKVTDE